MPFQEQLLPHFQFDSLRCEKINQYIEDTGFSRLYSLPMLLQLQLHLHFQFDSLIIRITIIHESLAVAKALFCSNPFAIAIAHSFPIGLSKNLEVDDTKIQTNQSSVHFRCFCNCNCTFISNLIHSNDKINNHT